MTKEKPNDLVMLFCMLILYEGKAMAGITEESFAFNIVKHRYRLLRDQFERWSK